MGYPFLITSDFEFLNTLRWIQKDNRIKREIKDPPEGMWLKLQMECSIIIRAKLFTVQPLRISNETNLNQEITESTQSKRILRGHTIVRTINTFY